MNLSEYITSDLIIKIDKRLNKEEILEYLVEVLVNKGLVKDKDKALTALIEREKLGSTAIGDEIAIPHAKLDEIDNILILLAVSDEGIEFDAVDGKPVKIFFLVLASAKKLNLHLKTLARISRLIKSTDFKNKVLEVEIESSKILEILNEEEAKL
jgi:PTS system nitrogen regulatory IIA component